MRLARRRRRRQPCVQGTASPERLRLHSRPLGWHAKGCPLWQGQHPILALCCTAHPWQGGQAAALLPRRASLADLCNEVAVLQQPGLAPREGLLGEPRGELGRQSTHAAVEHLHGRERLRGRGQQGRRVSGKSRRRVRACARGKKSRVATLLTSLQTRPVGIIIPLERRPAVAEGRRRRELADRPGAAMDCQARQAMGEARTHPPQRTSRDSSLSLSDMPCDAARARAVPRVMTPSFKAAGKWSREKVPTGDFALSTRPVSQGFSARRPGFPLRSSCSRSRSGVWLDGGGVCRGGVAPRGARRSGGRRGGFVCGVWGGEGRKLRRVAGSSEGPRALRAVARVPPQAARWPQERCCGARSPAPPCRAVLRAAVGPACKRRAASARALAGGRRPARAACGAQQSERPRAPRRIGRDV